MLWEVVRSLSKDFFRQRLAEYWPVEGHGIQEYLPSTECPPRAKSLKYIFISVGVQGMSPQHEPQCHTHYFELKLLEKLRTQEGNSDPPLSP